MARRTALANEVAAWDQLRTDLETARHLANESSASDDDSLLGDLQVTVKQLAERFNQLEFTVLLAGPYDDRDAIVAIHAGSGGTEAQDWAEMLRRMYLRYAEQKGWTARILSESRGEEAGIKSSTLEIRGHYAYGFLKAEAGVHRLVRMSPFDADHQRHTSFALVEALPELQDIPDVELDPKDLRIDTFMASGHGGQSVNTTYSAVRVVHLPTGITVSCQNERSQQQNRETAIKILKTKLHLKRLEEQQAEKVKLRGEFHSAEWGNQIRSYVLAPYTLVKDHRTKHESTNPDAVLNGELDSFIEAYLKQSVSISGEKRKSDLTSRK